MARTDRPSGLITGTVVRVTANGPIVEVPRIAPGYEEGPLLTTVKGLAPGDKVILSALAHDPDTLIVVGLVGGAHTHDAADLTTGVVDLARLPVTASGVSSATKLVRADDSRLSDARTPTAHQHAAGDTTSGTFALARIPVLDLTKLPVAPSGNANATQIVRADDARLSDARTPSTHTHDDRYYTETEADARYSLLAHTHDTRYALQTRLGSGGGTTQWLRVATVNGQTASNGGHITLLVSGQGSFGTATRAVDIVTLGQRGNDAYTWEGIRHGSTTTPWLYYVKQISTYVFELWARRTGFDANVSVTVLSTMGSTTALLLDSATTTDPALTPLAAPTPIGPSVPLSIVGNYAGRFTASLPNNNSNNIGHFVSGIAVPAGAVSALVSLSWEAYSTGSVTALLWTPNVRRVTSAAVSLGDTSLGTRQSSNFGIAAMNIGAMAAGAVDVRSIAGSGTLELHTAGQNPASSTAAVTVGNMHYTVTFSS